MELSNLPEECISHIISLTSPKDACRLSLVTPLIRAISDSDTVWNKFLPNDFSEIVSRRSVFYPILLDINSMPKKALFLYLSDNPIIIDNDTMSFRIEKQSGKKCFMIAARGLQIIWGGSPEYWGWRSLPLSRFPEVAHLRIVWWFEINGRVETNTLSAETNYGVYFVYKFEDEDEDEDEEEYGGYEVHGFDERPVELRVKLEGQENGDVRRVLLDPSVDTAPLPRERGDGWMEIEMGEFFNEHGDDGRLLCGLKEVNSHYKCGLILEGIEVRPKPET